MASHTPGAPVFAPAAELPDWALRSVALANPRLGAKALAAAGIDTLTTRDGKQINWRVELAKRLLDLQNADGFWVNKTGRWWESDPNLVTAYASITLEIIHRGL